MNLKKLGITITFICSILFIAFSQASTGEGDKVGLGETLLNINISESRYTPETDPEFLEALKWMFKNQMTKYETVKGFRAGDSVTREEASKFFGEFTVNVLLGVIDQTRYCQFDDIDVADQTLRNSIVESCMLYIFNGSGGYFFPKKTLTKAEALTVLIRGLEGPLDENGSYWRASYLQRARELKLTKEFIVSSLDREVTRYEIALLLRRSAKLEK